MDNENKEIIENTEATQAVEIKEPVATEVVEAPDQVYQYDAFISYRHVEPDATIAATLHKKLESYKFPENVNVTLGNGHTKIERVFRDEEELPIASNLEDAIVTALRHSEWLIVICSPRLIESQWCRLEIKTFIEMHGRDHVLAVLVEGEPDTAFPEELLYENVTTVDVNGNTIIEKKRVEPLAADVRGKDIREMKKKLESQKLKLIASMFGINYDALKQRHKANEARRKFRLSMMLTAAALIIGVYSTVMMLQLDKQNKRIVRQNERIEQQNNELLVAQAVSTANQSVLYCDADDRERALNLAYQACSEINGVSMPYTPEGEYALTNALNVYGEDGSFDSYAQLVMPGEIKRGEMSPDASFYAVLDEMGNLNVWRPESLECVIELHGVKAETRYNSYSFVFIDENKLMCVTDDGLELVNLNTATVSVMSDLTYYTLSINRDRSLVAALAGDSSSIIGDEIIEVYSTSSLSIVNSFSHSMLTTSLPNTGSTEASDISSLDITNVWLTGNYLTYSLTNYGINYSFVRVVDLEHPGNISQYRFVGDVITRAIILGNTMYVASVDTNNLFDIHTYYTSTNVSTGATNWQTIDNSMCTDFNYCEVEDHTYLLAKTYMCMTVYDANNGDELGEEASMGNIIKTYTVDDGLYFLTSFNYRAYLPLENGRFDNTYAMPMTASESTTLVTADLYYGVHDYVFMGKENSNVVYVFREVSCPGLSQLRSSTDARGLNDYYAENAEYLAPLSCEFISSMNTDITSYLNDFNVDDVLSVKSIVYDEDAEILVVNRTNSTIEIYTSEGRLGGDASYMFDRGSEASEYFGTDAAGNHFISTYGGWEAYRITPDGRIVSHIYNLVGVDAEDDSIVRCVDGVCMSQPIFDFDELLNKAEEYLDEYDN